MKRAEEFEAVEDRLEPLLKSMREEGINTFISALFKTPQEAEKGSPLKSLKSCYRKRTILM